MSYVIFIVNLPKGEHTLTTTQKKMARENEKKSQTKNTPRGRPRYERISNFIHNTKVRSNMEINIFISREYNNLKEDSITTVYTHMIVSSAVYIFMKFIDGWAICSLDFKLSMGNIARKFFFTNTLKRKAYFYFFYEIYFRIAIKLHNKHKLWILMVSLMSVLRKNVTFY